MNEVSTLKLAIKKHNIPYSYLSGQMGYTTTHICRVLNEKSPMSFKFKQLLLNAIEKYFEKDYQELKDLKEALCQHSSP